MTAGPVLLDRMGMMLEVWRHESCVAEFGVGYDWATLYTIESLQPGKGHATCLLTDARTYYESHGKRFAGSVALNSRMRRLYKKLGIKEHNE